MLLLALWVDREQEKFFYVAFIDECHNLSRLNILQVPQSFFILSSFDPFFSAVPKSQYLLKYAPKYIYCITVEIINSQWIIMNLTVALGFLFGSEGDKTDSILKLEF